jgi:hypothetical protein
MSISPATMSRMKSLMNLCEATEGMTPNEFEGYCELKGILTEWLVVSPTDFNDGIYHITLPDYGYRCVYSMNGSPIEISY